MKKILFKKRVIYLTFTLATLIVAFVFDRFYEMLLFTMSFNFIHDCFKKRFHSNSIESNPFKANWLCLFITILVQIIYLLISIHTNLTIYINLSVIGGMCFINCLLQDYIEKIEDEILREIERRRIGNRVYRGITLVDMEIILSKYNIEGIPNEVMHLFYVDRMKLQDIALELGYSIERIQQIKRAVLDKLTREI